MTNKKISELTSGGILRPTDEIAVNRAGSTQKVALDNINAKSRSVAIIGTSLVQQNDAAVDSSYRISHSNKGWLSWLRAYSKGRIYCPVWYDDTVIVGWEPSGTPGATRFFRGLNFGVSGQFIQQIVDRLPYIETNFLPYFTDIIIDCGANDAYSETKETIQTKRETVAQFFLDRGKCVHFLPILARDTTVTGWESASATRKKVNWINQKTVEFCNKNNNCFYLNWNKPWVNGTTTDGVPRTGFSDDGTHFGVMGADEVGEFMNDYFAPLLPPQSNMVLSNDDIYDSTDNPLGCIVPNPLLSGTGGSKTGSGVSGDVADSFRVEQRDTGTTTVVCLKEAKAGDQGFYQVLSFDNIDATSQEFYFRTNAANISHAIPSKWVQARCEIVTNNSDAIENVSIVLDDSNGTNGNYGEDLFQVDTAKWSPKNRDMMLETPPLLLKADSTIMRCRVEILIKGTASILPIIKISNFELRPIPDPTF